MSVLNQSGEEPAECPLCLEVLEVDDLHFYPCTCGYQICRFCWNRIREGENGLCPACRKAYPENPADFTPLSQEQVAAIKTEKKAREQRRRNKTLESRRALANVRVVQNNLVFVVGLPVRLADPEILKRQEYFGKYGKIHKVVINQSTTYAGSQGPSASAYVTYLSQADALRAIQSVNNVTIDRRVLKGSLGTTKYCANFMKNQPCPKTDCMYLHELGDPKASFTKEEMHQGLHQIYERRLHNALHAQTQKEQAAAAAAAAKAAAGSGTSTNGEKHSSKEGSQPGFIPTTIITSSNINIVNSNSKSKKDQSASSVSSGGSKEAWPSLSSSPPNSDSSGAGSKQASPKPQEAVGGEPAHTDTAELSQENGASDRSSPIQQNLSKHREGTSKSNRNKDQQNINNNSKQNRNCSKTNAEQKKWSKQKSNSINEGSEEDVKLKETPFEVTHSYDLDEFESDRHSLLDNHDLLDSSDHGLLEDEHSLLDDTNSDAVMMQRHREMLASLVDNNHMLGQQLKSNQIVDSFGLLDAYERPSPGLLEQKELLLRERNRSEMLMRQNEMMARHHNLMQPKHYMPSSSHNIGLDSVSDLLGANYQNSSILPPFGMRLDGTIPNTVQNYGIVHNNSPLLPHLATGHLTGQFSAHNGQLAGHSGQLVGNSGQLAGHSSQMAGHNGQITGLGGQLVAHNGQLTAHNGQLSGHSGQLTGHSGQMAGHSGQLLGHSVQLSGHSGQLSAHSGQLPGLSGQISGHNGQMSGHSGQMSGHSGHLTGHSGMHQMAPTMNGFSEQQEGRYLGENMDKFFNDFHKTQQLKFLMGKGAEAAPAHPFLDGQHLLKFGQYAQPQNMMSAHQLEMEQKQRQAELAAAAAAAAGAGGARAAHVDDDLDFDPFKETQKAFAEMMESELQQNGLSPSESAERMRRARLPPPGFSHMNAFGLGVPRSQPAAPHPAQDWTQMDPAIMSTSVNFPHKPSPPELFSRFGQPGPQPAGEQRRAHFPTWSLPYEQGYSVPLPPGFSELSAAATGAECIESK